MDSYFNNIYIELESLKYLKFYWKSKFFMYILIWILSISNKEIVLKIVKDLMKVICKESLLE